MKKSILKRVNFGALAFSLLATGACLPALAQE
jgi:hypothetical protein